MYIRTGKSSDLSDLRGIGRWLSSATVEVVYGVTGSANRGQT
jgi:hypothetical protein